MKIYETVLGGEAMEIVKKFKYPGTVLETWRNGWRSKRRAVKGRSAPGALAGIMKG